MSEEGSSYFSKYYAENKKEISEKKKRRYQEDPEYREKIKARARARKKMLAEERKKQKQHEVDRENPIWFRIEFGDSEIPVRMYTIGQLAKRLGRKTQTIRVWERKGIMPEATYRSSAKDRLYTELQVRLIVEAYDRAEEQFGTGAVSNRIGSTNFSDQVWKIWEEYPLGVEQE